MEKSKSSFKNNIKEMSKKENKNNLNNIELKNLKEQYKNTVEKLNETDAALNIFINSLHEPAFLIDKDFKIVNCNGALYKKLGKNADEVIGNYVFGYLPSNIAHIHEDNAKLVFELGQSVTFESFHYNRSYINSIYPINDLSGKVSKAAIFAYDITEKIFAERRIIESEEKYHTLVERIPEGIYRSNEKGKFLEINQAMVEILGYESKEELLKINIIDNLYVDKTEVEIPVKKNNISDKNTGNSEEKLRTLKLFRKDGSIIYTEDHENCIYDKEGNFLYYEGILRDVTDRIYAEKKLKGNEEKFRTFFESSSDLMYIADNNKNLTQINQAMCKTLGYASEELIQMKLEQIIDKESKGNILSLDKDKELYEKGKINAGINLISKDGKKKYGDIKITAIYDSKNNLIGSRAIFHDLTERIKYENILLESKDRYRSLLENLPVGIGIVSEDRKIVSANNQALKIFGYDSKDLGWLTTSHLYSNPEENNIIMQKIGEGKLVKNYEVKVKKKDESEICILLNIKPIKYSDENCYLVVFDDITDRKANEEKILKLSKAVEQSPASIIITDINGKIEYINKKFTEVTGYIPEEIVGKNPRILKSSIHSSEFYKGLWDAIKSGQEWRGELLNKKKNGDFYWEAASISPIRNGDGEIKYYLAVKEDITDKKKIEEELKHAKEKAERADRLKSEFLAQISHEIRTPINIILNFNDIIKEEIKNKIDYEIWSFFEDIELATKRILRTVDLILEMSTLQTGTYEIIKKQVDLHKDILEKLFFKLKPAADAKKIDIKLIANTIETRVIADEYSIVQIFSNLIDNAIKYTDKGEIEIVIEKIDTNKLAVSITDTGIGISKEYLPNLFNLFSQEDQGYSRRYEGTGLALALVKKYCELNGAAIFVESEKGRGSKFTITFIREYLSDGY